MKNKNVLKSLVIIIVVMMIATACSPSGENGEPKNSEAKDTVNFGLIQEPTTLDPLTSAERITFIPVKATHDPLVLLNEDGSMSPGIAESWEVSDDGTEYTFNIREGVRFHNGETLTAEDVVFTYESAIRQKPAQYGVIESLEALSDYQVKMTLKYSFSPFLYLTVKPMTGIVHKETYLADPEGYGRNPNGSGAFKFENWNSGDTITLVRNEDYWREPSDIREITFKIIPDETTEVIALEAGEIDAFVQVDQANKEIIESNENLKWYDNPGGQVFTLAFNNGKKGNGEDSVFAGNKALRQAVNYGINKEDLVIGAVNGSVPPLYTPFPKFVVNYPSEEDFDGKIYDIEKAKEKMKEAGIEEGFEFTIKTTVQPIYAMPAEIIQSQLSEIGFNVKVEKIERGTYLQEVYNNFNYDATIWAVSCDYPDADDGAYFRFYSENIGPARNYMQVNDPELDEAIMTNRISSDQEEKASAVLKYAEIIRDEAYALPLYSSLNTLAANKDLSGVYIGNGMEVDFYNWSWN